MAVDVSGVSCVAIGYNNTTNERTYTLQGAWNASTCYDSALMLHGDFRAILEAADSGASSPAPSTSAFTEQEIAALKYQAANPSPFNLTVQDGTEIGFLMLSCFAAAWAIKQLGKGVRTVVDD